MANPVLLNQNAYLNRWAKNWSTRFSEISRTPFGQGDEWRHLAKYDLQRVQKGQSPLSNREAALGLIALKQGRQVIPEPENNSPFDYIFKNPLEDIRDIVTGLPQLPGAVINELKGIQQHPESVTQALRTPGDIGDKLEALTASPGIRLIPGAFTVHNIAAGTPEVLAEHPVSTLLDVLPYASKLGLTAAAAKGLEPITGRATQFFREKGLGGPEARLTAKLGARAERGFALDVDPTQRLVLGEFDKAGLPREEGPKYTQWAEYDRMKGVPAPDPRYERIAKFQDAISARTNAMGFRTKMLLEHEGEIYSAQSRMGRMLGQINGQIDKARDIVQRRLNRETHWKERVTDDQARLDQLLTTGLDTPTVMEQFGMTTQEWAKEIGPRYLSILEGQLPAAPGRVSMPLHPGEVAWGEGQRHGLRQPDVRYELPKRFKDVRFEDGRVRSGAMDKLQGQLGKLEDRLSQTSSELMANEGRMVSNRPHMERLAEDIASTRQRLDAHKAVAEGIFHGTSPIGELKKAADAVRMDAVLWEPKGQGLLQKAGRGLTGEAAERYSALLDELRKNGNPDTAQALMGELEQQVNFRGMSRSDAMRGREVLRGRIQENLAAKAELQSSGTGLLSKEELAALDESLKRDTATFDALKADAKAAVDLRKQLEGHHAERSKLGERMVKEEQRLAKVHAGMKEVEGLAPQEIQLQKAYGIIDRYDSGDAGFMRQFGQKPFGEGITQIDQVRAIARDLEEQGWTAPPAKEKVGKIRESTQSRKAYAGQEIVKKHRMASEALDQLFGRSGVLQYAQRALAGGDTAGATELLSQGIRHANKLAKVVPEASLLVDDLVDLKANAARIPSTAKKVENAMTRLEKNKGKLATIERQVNETADFISDKVQERGKLVFDEPPARFIPKLNQMMRDAMYQRLNPGNDPEIGMQLQLRGWEDFMDPKEVDAIYRDYARQWSVLKEQGFDPIWTHHVMPNKARSVTRTSLSLEHPETPSSTRVRALDMADHIDAPEVAMTHQVMEWQKRGWTENFIWGYEGSPGFVSNHTEGGLGWTQEQVTEAFAEEMVAHARKTGASLDESRRYITSKHFTVFKPFDFVPWKPLAQVKKLGKEVDYIRVSGETQTVPLEVLVPKGAEKVIRHMIPRQGGPGFAYAAYDKAMNVFRISALAFAPRFQLYNTFGGAMMLMARTDPSVFKYWAQAQEMVGKVGDFVMRGEKPPGMPLELSRGTAVTPEFAQRLNSDPLAMVRFEQGKFFGKIWKGVQHGAEKSFQLNEWVDNMYRSMAYLYGEDKAVLKGMGKQEAREAGITLANKILQDWDVMLPWERTVLRNVLPFYGWMKHIAQYTFSYPFDHPLRASIISSLVRNEVTDAQTNLPGRFRQIMWLGEPDASGKQTTLNLAGANPWADVADMFTLSGFISQVSPAGQSVLEMMGVDLANARSSLYPDTTYDPETGRLQAQGKSPIESIVSSFIPQAEAVYGLGGFSSSMRLLRERDPEAWNARIRNSLGIPLAPRKRSKTEEVVRAELARDQAAADALRKAIRTGEWNDALRYNMALVDITGDNQPEVLNPAKLKSYIEANQG